LTVGFPDYSEVLTTKETFKMTNEKFMKCIKQLAKDAQVAEKQNFIVDYLDALQLTEELLRIKHKLPRTVFTVDKRN